MSCVIPLRIEGDIRLAAEIDAAVNIIEGRYQDKTVVPSDEVQAVQADHGYGALGTVTVEAIPSNWGRISWDGSVLTVS